MRLLRIEGLRSGTIAPHAPLLLPGVMSEPPRGVTAVRDALTGLAFEGAGAIVLLSSHGPDACVYRKTFGSLAGFGLPDVTVARETDDGLAESIANAWGEPIVDVPADHGVVVPLALMTSQVPVVAATVPEAVESSSYGRAIESGTAFAEAIVEVSEGRSIAFIASADTSAALSPRAPLTERPEGHQLDEAILDSLGRDCAVLADIPSSLWARAGSCGAGPLNAFARLFSGERADVLEYQAPFGVGYLIASSEL